MGYDGVQIQPAQAEPPEEIVNDFTGGYVDTSPIKQPLNSASFVDSLRLDFVTDGLQRDYGWSTLGAALHFGSGMAVIDVLIDHLNASLQHQFWRLYRDASGHISGDAWLSGAWSAETSTIGAASKLRAVSTQGVLCVSSGGTGGNPIAKFDTVSGSFISIGSGAPSAFNLFAFANRLVALRANGDPQQIYWCANGDLTNWNTTDPGVGLLVLPDTHGDVVDSIQAAALIGANTAALFREKTIARMFATGNSGQAIGVTAWILNLGTIAPDSVCPVGTLGVAFLGSDYIVYILTPDGTTIPIGAPIRKTIAGYGPTQAALAVATYDAVRGQYWISIGSDIWVFDITRLQEEISLARFRQTERLVWLHIALGTNAPTALAPFTDTVGTGVGPLIAATVSNDGYVTYVDPSVNTRYGSAFSGTWISPTLNRKERGGHLRSIMFRYTSPSSTSFQVYGSGDGGATWTSAVTVNLASTNNKIASTALMTLEVAGQDIRFKIVFNNTVACQLIAYHAFMNELGSLAYVS